MSYTVPFVEGVLSHPYPQTVSSNLLKLLTCSNFGKNLFLGQSFHKENE